MPTRPLRPSSALLDCGWFWLRTSGVGEKCLWFAEQYSCAQKPFWKSLQANSNSSTLLISIGLRLAQWQLCCTKTMWATVPQPAAPELTSPNAGEVVPSLAEVRGHESEDMMVVTAAGRDNQGKVRSSQAFKRRAQETQAWLDATLKAKVVMVSLPCIRGPIAVDLEAGTGCEARLRICELKGCQPACRRGALPHDTVARSTQRKEHNKQAMRSGPVAHNARCSI